MYKSVCLDICAKSEPGKLRFWHNMKYRGEKLFLPYDEKENATTGYTRQIIKPLVYLVDKERDEETVTTDRRGPYIVDLLHGTCTCPTYTGFPWTLRSITTGEVVACSAEPPDLIRGELFPDAMTVRKMLISWRPGLTAHWTEYRLDLGNTRSPDCKHLVGTYLKFVEEGK